MDPRQNPPDFDSLLPVEGQPQGCAWGLFGSTDQLGSESSSFFRPRNHPTDLSLLTSIIALNLLTPERKWAAAHEEIKHGISVSLDMPLNYLTHMIAQRIQFQQKIINFKDLFNSAGHDDELHFNTQGSSQWDGFTHSATKIPGAEFYYNGLKHTDVLGKRDGTNGIDSMPL
jgi:hypothetical protein